MRRQLEFLSTVVVAALMLGSCRGAQPEPTSEAGATGGQVQSLGTQRDIIPLDAVKKSQHGTVTQTVANTEISIESSASATARTSTPFNSLSFTAFSLNSRL